MGRRAIKTQGNADYIYISLCFGEYDIWEKNERLAQFHELFQSVFGLSVGLSRETFGTAAVTI
jgi:hypothetical protein